MKQFNYLMLAGVLCLTACAERPDLLGGGVGLSDNQISFSTNTVNGWQGFSGGSRAAVAANENGPLKMESSLGYPLYLHPIEQSGTYIYNSKDELITRSGALLPNDGNLLRADHSDAETRGAKYNGTGWTTSFGVSAIRTDKSNQQSSFFQNLKATPDGGSWVTTDPQYWPTDGSLSFYAYAPYCDDSHKMLSEKAAVDVANAKTVHYVALANDVEHQPDLIVANHLNATHGSTDAPNSVNLNFSHVLTAITFSVGSDMVPGTVKSIAIKGVKNEGDFDLAANTWKTSGADADFKIDLGNGQGKVVTGKQDEALTTGDQTLMMIPQVFNQTSNAKVEIVFNKDGVDKTLTAPLRGTQWDAGSTIIYKVSTSSLLPTLTLNKVTFPTDWSNHAEYGGKLKSDYQDNDQLGLYVVAPDGRVKAANVQVTRQGSNWSFPTDGEPHIKSNDKVFAYYPYQQSPQGNLPSKGSTVDLATLVDANTFFKTLEAAWSPNADQSTMDKMNASDLQVANAILSNTGSGINLAMAHAMGLADITLGSGIDYQLANDHSYMWHGDELVSNSFTGRKLNKLADDHYIAVVKSGVSTTISASSNDVRYAWKSSLEFNPASSEIQKKMAVAKDHKIYDYTLELGDIYYSDGALTHQADNLARNKTPIGIVAYIAKGNDDYWVEKNTGSGHGGHALVMCLKTIGSTSHGSFGNYYQWRTSDTDAGRHKINFKPDEIRNSANKSYSSGYLETNALLAMSATEFPAASAAKQYTALPAPKDKSTGWFWATAGQYCAAMMGLGGCKDPAAIHAVNTNSDSQSMATKIENALLKVGRDNCTEFCQSPSTSAQPWTASENDASEAICIYTASMNNILFNPQSAWKTDAFPVRPFLAF